MSEIKACPFCGPGNSIVECYQDDYGSWKVGCGCCGSHSGIRPKSDPEGRAKVIASWNRRPETLRLHAALDLANRTLGPLDMLPKTREAWSMQARDVKRIVAGAIDQQEAIRK